MFGSFRTLRATSCRPNIPLILPEEANTLSVDTQIQTVFQDMVVRHMEWVDMLWTDTAKNIAEPRIKAHRRYLKRLREEAVLSYKAYARLKI